jgi:hypothetical protein
MTGRLAVARSVIVASAVTMGVLTRSERRRFWLVVTDQPNSHAIGRATAGHAHDQAT